MSSLLSSGEKTQIRAIFDDMHDTFKQDIDVYINETQSVNLSSSYNPVYGRALDQAKGVGDKILTKHTISARVHYFKKSEEAVLDDTGLPSSANVIRLKVDRDGLDKLNKCSFVDVDGNKCSVISNPEMIGPFGPQFYKVYLKIDT
jgi:hypothetical protein